MEPFAALSIAASIIQIVDAGMQVVVTTREIKEKGSTVGNKELKSVAKDIQDMNVELTGHLHAASSTPTPLTSSEIALQNLASETTEVAGELLQALEKLEVQHGNKCWTSFRKALKTIWSKNKIEETTRRLEILRNELVLRTIVSLKLDEKLKFTQQHKYLESLESKTKHIAQAILDNRNFFTSGINETQAAILTRQDLESSQAHKRHEETIAAIATLHSFQIQPERGVTWSSSTFSDGIREPFIRDLREIQTNVLEFLAFRHMTDRRDEVALNYPPTFQWIFTDDQPEIEAHTNLKEWLRYGNGCYWVSGKAGSGKSTLMKFISEEPRTRVLLEEWASGDPLLCSSFYFWNAGTPMQKSQSGLLRSILHDALWKYPELIPIVFPGLCRAISRGTLDKSEPSFIELKNAFTALTNQEVMRLGMCFFIDGVDEYDGDHAELANLLLSIPSPNVKVVLSSRPIPLYVQTFSSCPRIQLHYLTTSDIYTYVYENVMAHRRVQELRNTTRDEVNELVIQIVEKASGVFLWVVLVVKSLLTGFSNYDEIETLYERLEELPADLESFYKHMLNQMQPLYRVQASKLLQIVYRNSQLPYSEAMTPLRLSLADAKHPETAIQADIAEMSSEERTSRCEEMQSRIRSRCCGLLETQLRRGNMDSNGEPRLIVNFLHKSVVDFLESPEVFDSLVKLTSTSEFDANLALASSSLLEIKTAVKEHDTFIDDSLIWRSLTRGLIACAVAEASTNQAQDLIVEEFDATMHFHWREIRGWTKQDRFNQIRTNEVRSGEFRFSEDGHWSNLVPFLYSRIVWSRAGPCHDSIFSVACNFGIKGYVHKMLEEERNFSSLSLSRSRLRSYNGNLAQTALNCLYDTFSPSPSRWPWDNLIEILKLSLQYGADPNLLFHKGQSPWQAALWRCETDIASEKFVELLEILLHYGADPNAPRIMPILVVDRSEVANTNTVFSSLLLAGHFRWWMSPLLLVEDAFRSSMRGVNSKTRVHKMNAMWNKLHSLISQKGGVAKEWVEEKKDQWDENNPNDKWQLVTDSQRQQDIIRELRNQRMKG